MTKNHVQEKTSGYPYILLLPLPTHALRAARPETRRFVSQGTPPPTPIRDPGLRDRPGTSRGGPVAPGGPSGARRTRPRGVDVKPRPPGTKKGPFGAQIPKMPFLGILGLFTRILTEILVSFCPFLGNMGKYRQKRHFWRFSAFFGLFRPFWPKNPDFRGFGPRGAGVLHQPLYPLPGGGRPLKGGPEGSPGTSRDLRDPGSGTPVSETVPGPPGEAR